MGAREKLALFNMISAELPGANVLDAFAGSGALGIEAISRGAKKVTFVEKSPKVAGVIREDLASLELDGEVIVSDAGNFESNELFNIIIADPPYDKFEAQSIIHLTRFLEDDGILVVSHPQSELELDGMELVQTKKYAGAHISIFKKGLAFF